ncbi:hypothetical protein [Streptomyces lichenis]|uniref:Small CPxCG-related zinc finger protein n=1 Tax=Streptomyces lichenis TaxID=2306967 RepID=A0ABT0I5S0_9ACTN|nr:hypothetical protein [Streptomyces lichenis]MCK8676661.1 hypothetical protein [Streptomyces lichenis]
MTQVCTWCAEPTDEPVSVAVEHVASGPGRVVYACPDCRRRHRLLPLDQHPADSWGEVRYETAEAEPR